MHVPGVDPSSFRRIAGGVLLLLALPAAWLARGVTLDNRLERWVAHDAEEQRRYEEFRATFGSDEFIAVVFSGKPLFDPAALAAMTDGLERLERVPGVVSVRGLPQVYRDLFGGEDLAELEREMTSTPFYEGLFLSRDARSATLLVGVEPAEGAEERKRLVASIRDATRPLAEHGFRVAVVGSTVLIVALDRMSTREAAITFPLAVLGSLLVLGALLRSPRAMLAAAVPAGASVVLSLGLVVATGGSLNMLTAALPSLIWVLGLSYAVHIISRYRRFDPETPTDEAIRRALAETRTGVTFSALTTVLGFLSLLVAGLPPVRELGIYGAVGMVFAFAASQTVVPLLVRLFRVPRSGEGSSSRPPPARWIDLPVRRPKTVLVVAAAVLAVAVASIPRIRLESNPLSFLPADDPVAEEYRWVAERVAGFYTAEAVVRLPVPWTDPTAWPVLEDLSRTLAGSPIVAKVVTPLDLLKKLEQWDHEFDPAAYRLPASRERAESLLGNLDSKGRAVLASLAAPSGRVVRISAVVREMEEGRFLHLVREAKEGVSRLPEGWSGDVTGQVLRLVGAQQNLVSTQLRSLSLAFVLVFLAVFVGLRSWRLTLVAIPPNLLPVAVTFASMAWLSIPLDAATVMVASVALGVAVDNSLHYLIEVSRERAAGSGPIVAARGALAVVAPTIAVATLAAFTGFASLAVSSFLPIRYYGALSAILMAAALAADLILTPAILAAAVSWAPRRVETPP